MSKSRPDPISFVKMQATGNDFIVIDNRKNYRKNQQAVIQNPQAFAHKFCPRRFGIGADGLILIEEARAFAPKSLMPGRNLRLCFRMRIFNPDGTEAEMCGNGARCAARLAWLKGIAPKKMRFQTRAGIVSARINGEKVKIGLPEIKNVRGEKQVELHKKIMLGKKPLTLHYIDTGVPHTVLLRKKIAAFNLLEVGPKIRFHSAFPRGTNVDLVEILSRHKIKLRTYERGVEGETLACGTGAIAASLIAFLLKKVQPPVEVETKGGRLKVDFNPAEFFHNADYTKKCRFKNLSLEGEARIIYHGNIKKW